MKKILLFLSFVSVCVFSFAETKNTKSGERQMPFFGQDHKLRTVRSLQRLLRELCQGRRRLKVFCRQSEGRQQGLPFFRQGCQEEGCGRILLLEMQRQGFLLIFLSLWI